MVMKPSPQEEVETALQVCHYCRQLCDADMFSAEPIWSCAWCQAVAHVRCHQQFHPPAPKPDKKAGGRRASKAEKSEKRMESEQRAAADAENTAAALVGPPAGGDAASAAAGGDGGGLGGLATITDSEAGADAVNSVADATARLDSAARTGSAAGSPSLGGGDSGGGGATGSKAASASGAADSVSKAAAAGGGARDGGGGILGDQNGDTEAAVSDSRMADAMGGLPPLVSGASLEGKQLPHIRCVSNAAEETASEAG